MEKELKTIWPPSEVFYLESIRFNTLSAINSLDRLEEEFSKIPTKCSFEELRKLDRTLILDNFQNIIIQAAGISKYFWPIRKSHNWRGKQLKEAFNIKENNPLKSRDLRNAIEHYDERLDNYLEKPIVGIMLPQYIGPCPDDNNPPTHLFRAYFTDRKVFHLLDQSYEVFPIIKEVLRIHDMLIDMTKNGSKFPKKNNENV